METKNQSIERTFAILEVFKKYPNGLTLTDCCEETMLHKSTVYRFLNTLIDLGYIRKSNLKYYLTYRFFNLSSQYLKEKDLIDLSESDIMNLSAKVNEVVHLVVREDIYCVYINKIEANNAITMGSRIGGRIPLLLTSVGRAIISNFEDEDIKAVYDKSIYMNLFDESKLKFENLIKDINETRKTGIGIDDEDNEPGIFCLGSAIKGSGGGIVGAISVSGPKQRMLEKLEKENIIKQVIDIAITISKKMGFDIDIK